MSTTPFVTFYRTHLAFPHLRDDEQEIVVTVKTEGPDSDSLYEFTVVHVGTAATAREPIALRVQLFADSWRAFRDLPEFFDLLATLDESQSSGRSTLTLADLIPSLEAMGWRDDTDTYANQHTHITGCLSCGQRLSA